jgi:hypothetical protein
VLLGVDLGLRSGFALYGRDGRLVRFSSLSFGTRARLRRGVWSVLSQHEDVEVVVVEGDRALGHTWLKAAEKRGARGRFVAPETWRERLLLPREQRSGADAKRHADEVARAVIEWSGAKRPTSLRHDVAEAICIGLWGVLEEGWLEQLPEALAR